MGNNGAVTTHGGEDREDVPEVGDIPLISTAVPDTERGQMQPVSAEEDGVVPPLDAEPAVASGGSHRADNVEPPSEAEAEVDAAAREVGAGRRTTVVMRYLLGRLAVDHLRRLTGWMWLVPLLGLGLLLVRPRWIGVGVLALGVLVLVSRFAAMWVLRRVSLPPRFRPVEEELRSAVEAGKANLRVELRRVGLPSRSWHLPVFVFRLARGDARAQARSRLREVDVDRVLPRAQLEKALRLLDETARPDRPPA